MKKQRKPKHFVEVPRYPGGIKALSQFVSEQLAYPEEALQAKVEGTVVLSLVIAPNGTVRKTNVISGIGYGCDEEACRVAQLLRFDIPKQGKKHLAFTKKIQIHFKLNQPASPTESNTIQINYSLADAPKSSKSSNSYQYTVFTDLN